MRINNAIYASKRGRKKRNKKERTPFRELKRWEIIVLGYRRKLRISCTFTIWKELLVIALCCSLIHDYEL